MTAASKHKRALGGQSDHPLQREARHWRDSLLRYDIIIDGEAVGRIGAGEEQLVTATHGEHELWLRISWCRSQRLSLQLRDDTVVEVGCRPGTALAVWAITFGRDRYIDLHLA